MNLKYEVVLLMTVIAWGLCGVAQAAETVDWGPSQIEKLREELKPLQFDRPAETSKVFAAYRKFYSLEIEGATHRMGTFKVEDTTIAVQVFEPAEPRGTVLILHGYLDHSGNWQHVFRRLVGEGYAVVACDLPGHGFSSGERGAIDDFSEYVGVFREFSRICRENLEGPYHVIGHSTGAGVMADALLSGQADDIDRVVLLAPLVRSAWYQMSKIGHMLAGTFTDSIGRAFRDNSSDEDFLKFQKADPLQCQDVPSSWTSALYSWNERMTKQTPTAKPVKIIQGTSDTTVDWQYNMEFFASKFAKSSISTIDKGGHQLMNEAEELRNKVLDLMIEHLAGESEEK